METDTTNMFGCYEMDVAAKKVMSSMVWDESDMIVNLDNFTDDFYVLNGFVLLAAYEWIVPAYPNATFAVTKEFLDRVETLSQIDVTRRHLHAKQY